MISKNVTYAVLEDLTDGVWLLHHAGESIGVNDVFWKSIGIKKFKEEVFVEEMRQFVFHEDRELFNEILNVETSVKKTRSQIIRFLHSNGKWIWFEVKIKDVIDQEFRRTLLFYNILSKKEQERIYDHFNEMNRVGGWYINMADAKIFWTPSMFQVHGMKVGKTPSIENAINFYREGSSRERIAHLFQRAVEEGLDFEDDFEFVDAKGKHKWVRSRGKPVMENGTCKMVYGTIQDITSEKQREIEMALSRKKFEQVFNSTYQFCGLIDPEGTLLEANDTATAFAGLQKSDVIGKKFWDAYWWQNSKVNQAKLKTAIERAAQGEFIRYNVRVWDKDKKRVTIDFSLKPLEVGNGKPSFMIAEGRIIQDLIDAQKSLQTLIRKTTQQNETLRNFAHIVSHNLNSHAGNISSLSGFINNSEEAPPEDIKSMLSQASERLVQTLKHVNEVVSINTSVSKESDKINLREEVSGAIETVSALMAIANAKVEVDIENNLAIRGVRAYVESIFLNLLTNALKYRKENKLCRVHIKAEKSGSVVIISVRDNGLGIDLNIHGSKMFGMYKTFHGNEDAKGIGLFITKNQIESMGGSISVDSEPGIGTTFTVKLASA
ncbi:MAG: PAS domain-containing sensor histidine kinase [Cryomorphaceae bacterium]